MCPLRASPPWPASRTRLRVTGRSRAVILRSEFTSPWCSWYSPTALLGAFGERGLSTFWGRLPAVGGRADRAGEGLAQPGVRRFDEAVTSLAGEAGLTVREREIFRLLARNYRLTQVRDELGISYSTVKTHTEHIYAKFGVHSQVELSERVEARREGIGR